MTERDDAELRRAFGALDRTMQACAPSFAELTYAGTLNAARRRSRARRAVLLIAAIVLPAFLVVRARSTQGFDFERFGVLTGLDPGAVSWQAPSDFLLSVPGADLLKTVPAIDANVPAIPADSTRPPATTATPRRSSDS
jgi:hypothetical protein